MPLPPPRVPQWLKITSDITRVTLLSEPECWYAHFDPRTRRPFRCGGDLCRFCDEHRVPELRIVLGCADGSGERLIFELRERHRKYIEKLEAQEGGIVGTVIDIFKVGGSDNSPVELNIVSRKPTACWDIGPIVRGLGGID